MSAEGQRSPSAFNEIVGAVVGVDSRACWYRSLPGANYALTDAACRNAKTGEVLKKLSEDGGLQLWAQPSGAKLWRLAYRYGGKQKLLAIGPYPLESLVADIADGCRSPGNRANGAWRFSGRGL